MFLVDKRQFGRRAAIISIGAAFLAAGTFSRSIFGQPDAVKAVITEKALAEEALAGLFQRVKPSFDAQVSAILARLRQSRVVCSDETGARVKGRNAWEWVFQNDQVCVHVIRNSRAKAVAEEVMAGHKPAIWVSDLTGAHGVTERLGKSAWPTSCAIANMPSRPVTRSSRRA